MDKPAQSQGQSAQGQPAELHFIGTRTAAARWQAAHDENNLYRNLVDALPVAIYLTDAAGRITYYNEAAAEMWGLAPNLAKANFAAPGNCSGRTARLSRTMNVRWRSRSKSSVRSGA